VGGGLVGQHDSWALGAGHGLMSDRAHRAPMGFGSDAPNLITAGASDGSAVQLWVVDRGLRTVSGGNAGQSVLTFDDDTHSVFRDQFGSVFVWDNGLGTLGSVFKEDSRSVFLDYLDKSVFLALGSDQLTRESVFVTDNPSAGERFSVLKVCAVDSSGVPLLDSGASVFQVPHSGTVTGQEPGRSVFHGRRTYGVNSWGSVFHNLSGRSVFCADGGQSVFSCADAAGAPRAGKSHFSQVQPGPNNAWNQTDSVFHCKHTPLGEPDMHQSVFVCDNGRSVFDAQITGDFLSAPALTLLAAQATESNTTTIITKLQAILDAVLAGNVILDDIRTNTHSVMIADSIHTYNVIADFNGVPTTGIATFS
jgi:hypothetical protein